MNRRDFLKYRMASLAATTLPRPGIRRLSGPADQADRAVLARRRDRRGRPALGGPDEGRSSAPSWSRTRAAAAASSARPKWRARQPDGETFLFGNTSTQVLLPGDRRQAALRSGQGLPGGLHPGDLAELDRGARVGSGAHAQGADRLRQGQSRQAVSYGSAGAGTMTNLAGELFKQLIGVPDITHIPYKGAAPGVEGSRRRPSSR